MSLTGNVIGFTNVHNLLINSLKHFIQEASLFDQLRKYTNVFGHLTFLSIPLYDRSHYCGLATSSLANHVFMNLCVLCNFVHLLHLHSTPCKDFVVVVCNFVVTV